MRPGEITHGPATRFMAGKVYPMPFQFFGRFGSREHWFGPVSFILDNLTDVRGRRLICDGDHSTVGGGTGVWLRRQRIV
jgi:hypothetical protein